MKKDFHSRFNLPMGQEEAKERFIKRVLNIIFEVYLCQNFRGQSDRIMRTVITYLGDRYSMHKRIDDYIANNFNKCLESIEGIYEYFIDNNLASNIPYLNKHVERLLIESEIDLGIQWKNGKFIPSGAQSLDDGLINDPLKWLSEPRYVNVLKPYSKGIGLYQKSIKHPELLQDVITDMYESLEALVKIVTGKPDRDLSSLSELFTSTINAPELYKKNLKEYIAYANVFRHAAHENKPKPKVSSTEVESFIYLTGIFIRLAIRCEQEQNH